MGIAVGEMLVSYCFEEEVFAGGSGVLVRISNRLF